MTNTSAADGASRSIAVVGALILSTLAAAVAALSFVQPFAAGFQAHPTKPIHPAELARVVATLAGAPSDLTR